MSSEEIIYEGKIPMRVFYFSHGLFWLLIFGWNIGPFHALWKSITNHLKITNQRIVLTKGLISQNEEEVEYYRAKDSKYDQSILGRIFQVGNITVWSDDTSAPMLKFSLHTPKKYREQIRDFIRDERSRMKSFQVD